MWPALHGLQQVGWSTCTMMFSGNDAAWLTYPWTWKWLVLCSTEGKVGGATWGGNIGMITARFTAGISAPCPPTWGRSGGGVRLCRCPTERLPSGMTIQRRTASSFYARWVLWIMYPPIHLDKTPGQWRGTSGGTSSSERQYPLGWKKWSFWDRRTMPLSQWLDATW